MTMDSSVLGGSCVALITPFAGDSVDEPSFRQLVARQITAGTKALIPVGTTGESPTLTHAEHKRVVELCIDAAGGRARVIAGAGSNSTGEAIDFATHAEGAGADALLVVTPYYNKPTQDGLHAHYTAIADSVKIPLIVYDIPGRSAVGVHNDTMVALAAHPNIVGIKDSSQDLSRPTHLLNRLGAGFRQFSGEDGTALAYRAAGGHGCISVTANIAPELLAEMHAAWDSGNVARAMEINALLMPLHEALFASTSPGPVKYAASLMGLCEATTRLPLCPIDDGVKARVTSALRGLGLID